jgi:hypothetical protein
MGILRSRLAGYRLVDPSALLRAEKCSHGDHPPASSELMISRLTQFPPMHPPGVAFAFPQAALAILASGSEDTGRDEA